MDDWIQFFGLLVPIVTLFGFLYRDLKEWRKETREEIKEIREEIRQQAARSDHLYSLFIENQKFFEQKGREFDQKFYDLLKAQTPPKEK